MKLVIENDGCLTEPNLHDGLLLGIVLSEEREDLTLICREVDGKEYSLIVPKIDRLHVDNFLAGNIIFGISIHQGEHCSPERVKWLPDYNDEHTRQYLPSILKDIADGGWTLLEITTSYGCELVALSKAHADEIKVV